MTSEEIKCGNIDSCGKCGKCSESKLVDLHTTSKKLEDIMLSDYPGKIFTDKQHFISGRYDFETDTTLYTFIDLHEKELLNYLPKIDEKIKDGWYYVRTSKKGDCLRIKSPDGTIRNYS